jgi:hypothetical protein
VKNALGINSTKEDGTLSRLILSASNQIERWLKRANAIQLTSRTEYFSPTAGQMVIYPAAYPITSITSIYTDSTGDFDGDETIIASTDYFIGEDGRSIVFKPGIVYSNSDGYGGRFAVFPHSLRVIYTGGLAASAVNSSWTKSADAGGTLAVGNYIQGATTKSLGFITARAAGTISYECIFGAFEAGETITEYGTLTNSKGGETELTAATGVTATLTAATATSLAESYPDFVEACEMHVRFMRSNRDSFDNINVTQDGVSKISRSDIQRDYFSLPEIRSLLDHHKNKLVM